MERCRPASTHAEPDVMNNRRVFTLTLIALLIGLFIGFVLRTSIGANTVERDGRFVLNPSQPVDSVVAQLEREGRLERAGSLMRYLSWRGWTETGTLKAGRYLIPGGMDNRSLARLLLSGSREAVRVRFIGGRSLEELAKSVAPQVTFDADDLVRAMKDPLLAARKGTDVEALRTRFIPNTYEVWYDVSAADFIDRMVSEWERWWTDERRQKAEDINLSPTEVGILASIVKAETSKMDEAPTVAGLYLNRLDRGIRLQADPTLIYALGDPTIRRVLNAHREINSPYNTYLNDGLPPGPINFPEPSYLKAVLNAEEHDYIFMCAREDFSGYHAFAKTNREHERNARRYRRALDKQGVYH
ncbi:MAG: aminodeoxychorismate lyase [Crocinitomicaceae bacterium]|nr:aminodeoxychorismate lyase [Crocinitomicaceae bacterium]